MRRGALGEFAQGVERGQARQAYPDSREQRDGFAQVGLRRQEQQKVEGGGEVVGVKGQGAGAQADFPCPGGERARKDGPAQPYKEGVILLLKVHDEGLERAERVDPEQGKAKEGEKEREKEGCDGEQGAVFFHGGHPFFGKLGLL